MLELGSKTITVDGVTVFADHADPDQFWMLPAEVKLARRGADDQPQFTLIKYAQEAIEGGVEGGGFLMFEVNLRPDPELERRIRARVAALAEGTPRLALVPFDEGTVEAVALDLQGEGGTTAEPPGPAAFVAVEEILGASVPSLRGDNAAAFSLTLSQEGAQILEETFRGGGQPVGVIYDLTFTGLRPALEVTITADFERIYDHFSASLDVGAGFPVKGVPIFIRADIDTAFETLHQEGVIDIKVTDFSSAEDREKKEKWALEFFKNNLLEDWFKPTLEPIQFDDDGGSNHPLGKLGDLIGSATNEDSDTGGEDGDDTDSDSSDNSRNGGSASDSASAERQQARLEVQDTSPSPLPDGYEIEHAPSASGTSETLAFAGGEEAPAVKVDGEEQTLSGRTLTVDVAPGQSVRIEATYPAAPEDLPRFYLYFDFDKPDEEGWHAPSSERFQAYLNDDFEVHQDERFAQSNGSEHLAEDSDGSGPRGANALWEWVRDLPDPKDVSITAHASFEDPDQDEHNQRLSERRLQVASAIVQPLADIVDRSPEGDDLHERLHDDPDNTKPPEEFRVAIVEGKQEDNEQPVTINATLARPEVEEPDGNGSGDDRDDGDGNGDNGNGDNGNGDDDNGDDDNGDDSNGGTAQTGVSVAFTLRRVKQEELKKVTLHYNRAEAVQQRYAPQGFFGLLVEDLDESQHFFDVRLNDPFFREFAVNAESPIDFEEIGLTSVHVALDYGDPSDPDNHAHEDFSFDAADRGPKEFRVLMNEDFDTHYTHQVQYHFDPQSDWVGEQFSYALPEERTEDRTLLINPFDQLGFMEIEVTPGEIDPGIVERIDVHLSYEDPGRWQTEKRMQFTADSDPQQWRVRLSDREARTYTYRLVHHLTNGTTRETEPNSSETTALTVDDPFVDALDLKFETLLLDPAEIQMVFVDVEYEDPDNDYRRRESLRIPGDAADPRRLRIALLDPDRRTYRYQLTFVGTDNEVQRDPFVTTDETRILIGEE